MASRRHIPRGRRTNYIPGLTEKSKSLYAAYQKQYSKNPFDEETIETGDRLTDMMTTERKEKWEESMPSIFMETIEDHSSPQTWEGFYDPEKPYTNIPLMSHVQSIRTTHPKQYSAHA